MDWEIFWTVLGGAVGGATISGIVALVVKSLDRKHEQRIWLRNTQHRTYIEVGTFLKDYSWKLREDPDYASEDVHNKLVKLSVELPMVSSHKVDVLYTVFANQAIAYIQARKAGLSIDQTTFDLLQTSVDMLTKQMGQDLHQKRPDRKAKKALKSQKKWDRKEKEKLKRKEESGDKE